MFQRKSLDIFVIAVYSVIIALFYILSKSSPAIELDPSCMLGQKCYRFCCNEEINCNEDFIQKNFNSSVEIDDFEWFIDEDESIKTMKIFYGKPICFLKETDSEIPWKLDTVNFILKYFCFDLID